MADLKNKRKVCNMAGGGSIQSTGKNSWKLTVSGGFNGSGKRIRHTKTVNCSEQEARKELALFVGEVLKGNVASQKRLKLCQFYNYWKKHYAEGNLKPKTVIGYNVTFKRIETALGHLYLDKIEPRHLHEFYKNLEEEGIYKGTRKDQQQLSSVTIQKHHKLLNLLYNKAVKWGFAPYNPCEKVEAPKAKYKKIAIYDQDQTAEMLDLLSTEDIKYQAMILTALTSGIRRGELFGITWKCVDFEKCNITIEQEILYIPNEGLKVSDLKTSASYRTVSVPDSVMQVLKRHKAEQSAQRLKLGGTVEKGGKWEGAEEPENDFAFTAWNGNPGHPDSLNSWLRKFTTKHGLTHISPHAFRHMNATYLITSGVDVRTVSGKLGHARTSTTTDIYSHLLKSAEQQTADVMEGLLTKAAEDTKEKKEKQKKAGH